MLVMEDAMRACRPSMSAMVDMSTLNSACSAVGVCEEWRGAGVVELGCAGGGM